MAHAERREQFAAREAKCVSGIAADGVADQMRENEGVAVVIIPRRAWCGRERRALGIGSHVVFGEFHEIDRLEH